MNEIYVYGTIWENFSAEFAEALRQAEGDLKVRINSVGGDVFQALACYNLLKEYKGKVEVVIDGLCASAATIIMLGGERIVMQKNALLMIHLPSVYLKGAFEGAELAKALGQVSAVEKLSVETYKTRCKKSDEEILQMMKSETWLTAQQAKELGFVDEVTDQVVVNMFAKPSKENILDKFIARIAAKLKVAEKTESKVEAKLPEKTEEQIAAEYFAKMLSDNLTSGAEKVTGSAEMKSERKRQAEMIARFANNA